MKCKKFFLSFMFILFSCLLVGCTFQQNNPTIPPFAPKSTSDVQGLSDTPIPPIEPSLTLELNTPSPTTIPTYTITPRQTPTLSLEEAEFHLMELLQENGGCDLPCFWGIQAGQADLSEVENVFGSIASLTRLHNFGQHDGFIGIEYLFKDWTIHLSVQYIELPNFPDKVGVINFSSYPYKNDEAGFRVQFRNEDFNDLLNRYTLTGILEELGPPDEVFISTAANIPPRVDTWPFHTFLLYPAQGFFVEYESSLERINDVVVGCPLQAFIEFWGVPPELVSQNYDALYSLPGWEYKNPRSPDYEYKLLEDVTQLSVEDFYHLFLEGNIDTCIETPAEIWPTIEE